MFVTELLILILSSQWVIGIKPFLAEQEVEIIYLLLNHFHGSSCILGTRDHLKKYWPQRVFSERDNHFLAMLTHNQIIDYMTSTRNNEKKSGRSMIVLKNEEHSFLTLKQISQNMSISAVIWIMFSEEPLKKENFEGIYIPFNCEFIYVNQRQNTYLLTEIYQLKKRSAIETYSFGFWTKNAGLSIREEFLYRRRGGLQSSKFGVITGSVPPYITYHTPRYGKPYAEGYLYEVWKEIEYRVKIRSKLYQHFEDKKKIEYTLKDDNVQFAVLPVIYDSSVLDHMDVTFPVYESKSYLFAHRPGSELQWNSYLKPFDSETWWVSLAWMTCSSIALSAMYKIAWKYGTSEREAEHFTFTFSESVATVFRAVCAQGSDVTPRSNACRLLFLSVYLTALVLSSAFSAALFSLLTIPVSRAPFSTFQEVIDNKAYILGIIYGSNIHKILSAYISSNPASIQGKLLNKVHATEGYPKNISIALDTVCQNKKFVLLSELPYVLHVLQNMTLECQETIMHAGPTILRTFIGFGLEKDSPYKELIDYHILKMRNEGVSKRLLLNFWPPRIPSVQASWMRITIADISPILYMYGTGVIIAVILLATEKLRFLLFKKGRLKKPNFFRANVESSNKIRGEWQRVFPQNDENTKNPEMINPIRFWRCHNTYR